MIVVAGLPRSGNYIIAELIQRCTLEKAIVWHGHRRPPVVAPCERVMVVIPVRNPRCRLPCAEARAAARPREAEFTTRVFEAVVRWRALVKLVSYEAFVGDHEQTARDLIEWLNIAWVPFEAGHIYDGNAKHLNP